MSNAYRYEIKENGFDGSHSVSPEWVVTFVRWQNRYLLPESTSEVPLDFLQTREVIVETSACASVSVSTSKSNHNPSCQIMMYATDINYLTAVSPGDYVLINMLNFPEQAQKVAEKAALGTPINGVEDGFKGYFRITSVRRVLSIDPGTGVKRIMFKILGFAFSEFNNKLYFSPILLGQGERDNQFLFVSKISTLYDQKIGQKGTVNIQDIIEVLVRATIGDGPIQEQVTIKENLKLSENSHFFVPQTLGRLIGKPKAKTAADINSYLFGVQDYGNNRTRADLASGMTPYLVSSGSGNFLITNEKVDGFGLVKPEYSNEVVVWSLLNQYLNSPINEMYLTYRIQPDSSVQPTMVLRQMPFSSDSYDEKSTKYTNLPRWVVSPVLLKNIDIGRDEALRFNFVQIFSQIPTVSSTFNETTLSDQIARKNYVVDVLDIRRSGLKTYIHTSNFDELLSDKQNTNGPRWARLMADAIIGGELKFTGTVETYGIVEPISVGDNLELDGVIYHIESVTHSCSIQPGGVKSFTTLFQLSHGLDIASEGGAKVFPQMVAPTVQQDIEIDQKEYSGNLPAISSEKTPNDISVPPGVEKPFFSNPQQQVDLSSFYSPKKDKA